MAITFTCPCGQPLAAETEHAGLQVRCPQCQQTQAVPQPHASAAQSGGAPDASNRSFGFTDSSETARERDRQAREAAQGGRSFEGNVLNGGVMGGVLAMVGAVVWFVAGLAADVIFFYPPILFIIGLVAFFKGLAEGSSRR